MLLRTQSSNLLSTDIADIGNILYTESSISILLLAQNDTYAQEIMEIKSDQTESKKRIYNYRCESFRSYQVCYRNTSFSSVVIFNCREVA